MKRKEVLSLPTQGKIDAVAEIGEKFASSQGMLLVDYRGLSVKKAEELRRSLREAGSELKVYKNNLVKIVLEEQKVEGLDELLAGPTACVFIEGDPVAPAKAIKDFAKENPLLEIKGGYTSGNVLSVDQVIAIADLPSREELIAKLLGTLNNPVTKVVRVINGPATSLVTALKAIADQKEAA